MSKKAPIKPTVMLLGEDDLRQALKDLQEEAKKALQEAVQAGAQVVMDEANRNAPGPHVISKVSKRGKEYAEVEIGPDKEHWYYQFFETGATAHEIPKKKSAGLLHFTGSGGDEVFTGGVDHPGMPAKPFLRPAIDEHGDEARERAGVVLREVIEAVQRDH